MKQILFAAALMLAATAAQAQTDNDPVFTVRSPLQNDDLVQPA
jgi:hypothetical protein